MVYSNRYAYDSRRGQNPTLGIYGNYGYNPYSVRSTIEGYEDHNSTRSNISNYTLRVMPYDEDLRGLYRPHAAQQRAHLPSHLSGSQELRLLLMFL